MTQQIKVHAASELSEADLVLIRKKDEKAKSKLRCTIGVESALVDVGGRAMKIKACTKLTPHSNTNDPNFTKYPQYQRKDPHLTNCISRKLAH